MTDTMKACVLTAPGRLEQRTVSRPRPGRGELLVSVLATGVCGSDLAAYRGTHPYKTAPTVLGHEFCGVVEAVGADVSAFRVGDKVCAAAYVHCGTCDPCAAGRTNLCQHKRNLSHLGWNGSFAEYVLLDELMTYRLPAGLDPALGAMVEPLSIGLHAVGLAAPGRGDTVAIIGAGGIGLATLITAKRVGVGRAVCVDLGSFKGELARACGADGYVDAARTGVVEGVTRALGGPADLTVVAAGHATSVSDAIAVTRPGGRLVVVSYFDGPRNLDLNALVSKELSIQFSALSTAADFERVIGWLAEGSIDPRPLVTHRLPLADGDRAMRLLAEGGQAGKIIFEVGD